MQYDPVQQTLDGVPIELIECIDSVYREVESHFAFWQEYIQQSSLYYYRLLATEQAILEQIHLYPPHAQRLAEALEQWRCPMDWQEYQRALLQGQQLYQPSYQPAAPLQQPTKQPPPTVGDEVTVVKSDDANHQRDGVIFKHIPRSADSGPEWYAVEFEGGQEQGQYAEPNLKPTGRKCTPNTKAVQS